MLTISAVGRWADGGPRRDMKEMDNKTHVRFNVTVDKPKLVTLLNCEDHLEWRIRMEHITERIYDSMSKSPTVESA